MIEKLSPQHKRFVYAYVACLNKTQAYLIAYPNSTAKDAKNSAYRLAQQEDIKEAIEEVLATELENQKTVLRRLVTLIEFDLTEYLNDALEIDVTRLNKDGLGWIVKGIRQTKFGNEIYLIDKDKVLEMLSKAHNLFDGTKIEVNFNERLNSENLLNEQLAAIRLKFEGENSTN